LSVKRASRVGQRGLEVPLFLEDVEDVLPVQFRSRRCCRGRRREWEEFGAEIADKFAVGDAGQGSFDGFFFLHFVILALGGNAPGLHVEDFGFGVNVGNGGAPVFSAEAKDL